MFINRIVTDAKEGFKTLNSADKIADLVKEVRKDTPLGETESEDDISGEESDYSSDRTLSEDASCSDDSEEELSCSDSSEEDLSCSGGSEEELSCSGGSEQELSCSGSYEEDLSCTGVSKGELSEEDLRSTCFKPEFSEENSFQILTNQSSSEGSVQKIDAAEAAERKQLWEEETKAYYDR